MKTVKELYVTGMMTARTHTAIHKAMNSTHNFKEYDDTEWMTMNELLASGKIKGALRGKVMAMANL
ncbi:MAG: hypothetical protein MJ126_09830 [Lachnospiraceae bacterium]|nr:hypothetical protein [Lachnospiraceae bacterium]